jgi:hypothetical protein
MKEANNQNLFGVPNFKEKEAVNQTPVAASPVKAEAKPYLEDDSVLEVRFCTGGRLSAPPVLHFRDYNMRASQAISEMPLAADHLRLVVKILNAMVVEEDFDCGLLHLEEAKEILMNVHGKWWGSTISGFRYLLNPDLEDEKLIFAKENISEADIPISAIEVKPLDPEIKEPVNITVHGVTVGFVYPRIQNAGIIDDSLKVKYAEEEQRFFKLKQILEFNSTQKDPSTKLDVNIAESEEYQKYLADRAEWRTVLLRAQEIVRVNGDVFNSGGLDERIDAVLNDKRITTLHWIKWSEFLGGKGKFGVNDEAEFYSDVLNQKVRRPFRFHTYSFIPNKLVEPGGDEPGSVSFG